MAPYRAHRLAVISLLIAGFFCSGFAQGQQLLHVWVQFTDKNNSPYSLNHPEAFLSQDGIDLRKRRDIPFDALDLPVNPNYVDQVLQVTGGGLHVKSKWLNGIVIQVADSVMLEPLAQLSFVSGFQKVKSSIAHGEFPSWSEQKRRAVADSCEEALEYGYAQRQVTMLNAHRIHALGWTGQGVRIAQFDAGWTRTDMLPCFQRLRNEGRIRLAKDIVFHDDALLYSGNNHGTFVLSTMAGSESDSLIGLAPDADYYLFRTEDPFSESPIEEINWVVAAEMCDSIGMDIITSSLGYSLFDDASLNHSYADMDGNTCWSSRGADIAAKKGMLVFVSAGNSGANAWHYITAPSDADSVVCVGAVNANEMHAAFSGFGPSSDGEVKPWVVAMGQGTAFADLDSTYRTGNGTSFSCPIMAAGTACLMSAFPDRSNMQWKAALAESSSLWAQPNDSLGYGIPDFFEMYLKLAQIQVYPGQPSAFPNPCTDHLRWILPDDAYDNCTLRTDWYDQRGQLVVSESVPPMASHQFQTSASVLKSLSPGWYTVHISNGRHDYHVRVVKMNP
ncbi:MAG: S8 family serine peptidase [Flavobacteriales bacterium]